jgi:N-acetylmuramoyl-L-alanine amidase
MKAKTFSTVIAVAIAATTQAQAAVPHAFSVVLDPGHGGSDQGTVFELGRKRIEEKDVTLALAREAAKQLRKRGIRAILTRATDKEVPLAQRTAVANKLNAGAFISIHMNSTATPMTSDAEGVETFILNHTSDASSRRLARLENSVLGKSAENAPDQTDVALILKDLTLDANRPQSSRLACYLQRSLIKSTGASLAKRGLASPNHRERDRGVKEALFHVLLGADMPSALVEVGFLTNPRDRSLVLSAQGQKTIGQAIAQAVLRYSNTKKLPNRISTCPVVRQGAN